MIADYLIMRHIAPQCAPILRIMKEKRRSFSIFSSFELRHVSACAYVFSSEKKNRDHKYIRRYLIPNYLLLLVFCVCVCMRLKVTINIYSQNGGISWGLLFFFSFFLRLQVWYTRPRVCKSLALDLHFECSNCLHSNCFGRSKGKGELERES